jgi:hypothetical protein
MKLAAFARFRCCLCGLLIVHAEQVVG